MKTATFAVGLAAGYVLGTRAGREKYEQILDSVHSLSNTPAVQQAQSTVKNLVGQGTRTAAAALNTDNPADVLDDTSTTAVSTPAPPRLKKASRSTTDAPDIAI